MTKLKKREKEELFPTCSVRTKLHQERLRLHRRKKVLHVKLIMPWEAGALQEEAG